MSIRTRWMGAAAVAVLAACSWTLQADDKDKPERSPRASHGARENSRGQQRSESGSRPAARESQPAPQGRQYGRRVEERPAAQQPAPAARPTPNVQTPAPAPNNNGRQFGQRPAGETNRPVQPAQPAGRPAYTPGGNPSYGSRDSQPRPMGNSNPSFNGRDAQPRPGGYNNSVYNNSSRPSFGGGNHTEVTRTRGGAEIYRGPGGAIRQVRTPSGAVIYHAPGGMRRVEMVRPGGRVVVATTRNYGYVQRPLVVNNVTYVQRTYVMHGVPYARVYRPWVWGGVTFHVYTPVRYYRPAFYSWAWSPWPRPVYYSWGWGGRPWYGYYGWYFSPYPYYTSPALWLTDYLIASTLEAAYEERMAAAAQATTYYPQPSGQQVALTPEVKQAIADEVHRQLDYERAQAQNGPDGGAPPLFSDNGSHVFVVSDPLQVYDGGAGCALTEGDVLQMNGAPPAGAEDAQVVVLASKGNDCRRGSRVQVSLADLQEMQNQMRATLDQGLNDLQSKQGQSGIPQLPPNAAGATNTQLASEVRPDPNATTELSQAAQEAERAERDVVNEAPAATVSLGMSVDEVERSFGKPREVADLGQRKVYVYDRLKIVFIDGKVADVQ